SNANRTSSAPRLPSKSDRVIYSRLVSAVTSRDFIALVDPVVPITDSDAQVAFVKKIATNIPRPTWRYSPSTNTIRSVYEYIRKNGVFSSDSKARAAFELTSGQESLLFSNSARTILTADYQAFKTAQERLTAAQAALKEASPDSRAAAEM